MKNLKEFLNRNLVSLIVVALIVIVYFQRCNGVGDPIVPKEIHDTVIVEKHYYHDTTFYRTNYIPTGHVAAVPKDIPPTMVADTNYNKLVAQFDSLKELYYSKNIYKDSIKIDSIGFASVEDTIGQNKLLSRKWGYHFDIKERLITINNTYYPKPKRQVYIGGAVLGNETQLVTGGKIGLFYKDRKDRVYGIAVQKIINVPITYELSNYWKIKFKNSP